MVCHEMAFLPPPSSDHQFFFQNHHQQLSEHHHDAAQNHHQSNSNSDPTSLSILTSSCPPQDFLGHPHLSTLTMMNHHHHSLSPSTAGYGGGGGSLISNDQFTAASNNNHHHVGSNTNSMNGEEDALSEDEASHFMALGEKKKRLNMEQVKTLEKNFELGNKLEPERKMQLAKALGLQPRQVAIWFQNRRARWKTKQLEKDYNLLKRQFDNLKADNELLQTQNKKLHAELVALKNGKEPAPTAEFEPAAGGGGGGDGAINLNTETKSYCWSNNGSDISSDINLGISTTPTPPHGDHHHHQQQPHSPPPPACNIDNNHKLQFQSSFLPMSLTDLLTKPSSHHPHHDHTLQDDGFCTLFGAGGGSGGGGTGTAGGGGVASEQPPPFWAWPTDQHHMQ